MPEAESSPPILAAKADFAAWQALVERSLGDRDIESLRSHTREGIPIEPLYERRRDGSVLVGRGAKPWLIVQPIGDPDPDRANERALAAVKGGATGLSVHFSGVGAASPGLPLSHEALVAALDGIDLAAIHLRLDPHEDGLRLAEWLKDSIATSGLAPERADVSFGLDPVAVIAAGGSPDPKQFATVFRSLRNARFRGPIALLDGRRFHEAGATGAQELAAVLAAGAWWLRALDEAGVAPDAALPFFGAGISAGCDVLLSIAKLRALRLLWGRFKELCDAPSTALHIHAETSRRMLTRADVLDNLLRNTLAAFAAGVGGADAITVAAHTAALGITDRNARALAHNIQHLLMDEADLHRVADPAAGSGALEALSDELAERSWEEFRTLEREGGLIESLRAGQFQKRIADASRDLALAMPKVAS